MANWLDKILGRNSDPNESVVVDSTEKPSFPVIPEPYIPSHYTPKETSGSGINLLSDLDPIITKYNNLIKENNSTEAHKVFMERLADPLFRKFSAYQRSVDLLLKIFPDGEDKPPSVDGRTGQAWMLNALAAAYSRCGQPFRAVNLRDRSIDLWERNGYKKEAAIVLGNLAHDLIMSGEFEEAELNLRHSVKACRKIKDEYWEAAAHKELGLLLAYKGDFLQSEEEFLVAKERGLDKCSVVEAYISLLLIIKGDYGGALEVAQKARQLAGNDDADIIRAEWMLGMACRGNEQLSEAQRYIDEALTRCRQTDNVSYKANLLLELARLRREQIIADMPEVEEEADESCACGSGCGGEHVPEESEHSLAKREAFIEIYSLAKEALSVAERCRYRLQQADIQLFLAQLAIDVGDKDAASYAAEAAYERASCGYKHALEGAMLYKNIIGFKSCSCGH